MQFSMFTPTPCGIKHNFVRVHRRVNASEGASVGVVIKILLLKSVVVWSSDYNSKCTTFLILAIMFQYVIASLLVRSQVDS